MVNSLKGKIVSVTMGSRLFTRRRFVAAGAVAGVGTTAWMATSSSWSARFLRDRFREWGRTVPDAPHKPSPATWNDNAITLAWLGHATVLINFYGMRVITDPVLFPRIGVDVGIGSIGPLRLVQCALTPEELPEIDLVLVSHAHFDHLDTPSLASLPGTPSAVMAWSTADLLPRDAYASVSELRWNESTQVSTRRGDVLVRAIEVKHWGARVQRDTYRGYTGFVLEREGRRLLIGGDTAATSTFREHKRFGPFAAAVMPIGAYDPWIRNHCTPEQAISMADAAGAQLFVPVHHQSFRLSSEPVTEPIERAEAALASERGRLAIRAIGETVSVAG
jgi:L-ascorbate metabolism protein UlaG (beta-lactamase superfamily)